MNKDEAILFAKRVSQLDIKTCATIVQSLMLTRTLSKVVRDLDKLALDKDHGELARKALKRLGFDIE